MSEKAQKYPGFSFVRSSGGISEYTLDKNGLQVLLKEEHSIPVATCMVTYRVGSRNEAVGYTGSTHILEHMMFMESKNYPRHYWNMLLEKGARQNASTWLDRTNYYQTLPVEYLKDTLGYEADRMRNAIFKDEDLKTEMTVVRNEYEWRDTDPHEKLDTLIWSIAYIAHPYHHPTIGWRSDIENTNVERLKWFYDKYYWPDNATLTIVGDIDTRQTLSLVNSLFADVPRSPAPIPGMLALEPKQEGPRRASIIREGETNMVGIAHKIPPAMHDDMYAVQVLSEILGGGKSSRLHRALVNTGLSNRVNLFGMPFHDNGLFIAYAWLTKDVSHEKIEKAILAEYEKIKSKGPSRTEMEKTKARLATAIAFSRDGTYSVAGTLNEAIAVGDWTYFTTLIERIEQVTEKDVVRVAREYLIPLVSTTGYLIAQKKKK